MTAAIGIWLAAVLVTLPFAVVVDRDWRADGVPPGRRRAAWVALLALAPLGAGFWAWLLRPHRRS